ncbi:MAG: UDP-glucose 4-epimerase GalE [Sulfuricurvum sp. PD_MW2]|jgi:UDP-glucose 4-epimerase|uniref:UDP-glucose 4-epimerase GalE n=1 Tax=Sulfuricurvum sp. PD_MW2 TaxID=2027917 RepID=UPI000C05E255|nr:UDP-glucose 4-epimerase GalE [Sulfuricurvum sp. PD_MW2]PHM17943.1 MAG: UDP-glucose 4-epimerase GalE [Sulfuricurvum sp. PD_MW2]
MHILVTGGAGYIGSHVVKQLLEETEHDVTIIDNLSTGHQSTLDTLESIALESKHGDLRFYHADLSDFASIEKIFLTNRFDALMHFAASIVVPESVENPLKYYMNNTLNTTNLIRLCTEYKVGKFIFSSTAAIYGEPTEIPVKEATVANPINPYGMSKLMSERVLQDTAAANPDFNFIILRYFNVAGADVRNRIGQSFPNATHLIKVAAQTALGYRDKIYIFGTDYDTSDGSCIRDYIHVDDLASAHLKALKYLSQGNKGIILNCGYGHGFSVYEVIDTMKKISGIDFSVKISPRRSGDPALLISDCTNIKKILDWIPQYDDLNLICQTAFEWEKKTLHLSKKI